MELKDSLTADTALPSAMTPDSMPAAEQEDTREQPLRILLLGKSGAGKSSSGNTILGQKVFKSDMKLTSVTQYCDEEVGTIDDIPVAVIDTPGLFETNCNKNEMLKSIKLQVPGPHAFVVVVPLARLTLEDQETNTLIETKFGPRVWDYTIVLFTHGDRLEGKTINDVIAESNGNLRNFIRKCSGGFHVFNNKNPEDQEQVTSFLTKIQTLVALNGGGHYQNEFYPPEEMEIRQRQDRILTERGEEISRKEKALQQYHQGEDLEKKKKELWKKEEVQARLDAEMEMRKIYYFFGYLMVLLLALLAFRPLLGTQVCLLLGVIGFLIITAKIKYWDIRNRFR